MSHMLDDRAVEPTRREKFGMYAIYTANVAHLAAKGTVINAKFYTRKAINKIKK